MINRKVRLPGESKEEQQDSNRLPADTEPAAVRDALAATQFQSVLGSTIEFDANNLVHNNAMILERGRGGGVGIAAGAAEKNSNVVPTRADGILQD